VNLYHRSDCCQQRLLTATVVVSDAPSYSSGSTCGLIDDHLGEPDETQCNLSGRYVTVVHHNEYITICELQVMAYVASAPAPPPEDYVCVNGRGGNTQTYDTIFDQPLGPDKSLIFRVKAANDAHVGFFGADQSTSEVYEIVLGGWGNTQSVIRESNQGRNQVVVPTPGLVSGDEMRPFWATANNGLIRVGRGLTIGDDEFMRWQDPVPHAPAYVGIMDGWGSDGTWEMCHVGWTRTPTATQVVEGPPPPRDPCPDGLPTKLSIYKFNLDPMGTRDALRDWDADNCGHGINSSSSPRSRCTISIRRR
jgi:hypothetical protein